MWDDISASRYERSLNSGIVLTGGASILEGLPEIAEQISICPSARRADGRSGLADHVASPVFATPVGLTLYAHHNRPADTARVGSALSQVVERFRGIFKEFF